MKYTEITLELANEEWVRSEDDDREHIAYTIYQGRLIKVKEVEDDVDSIIDCLQSVLLSNSAVGRFTRVTEFGKNYAVYEEMYQDEYNQYQSMKYLIITSSVGYVFTAPLTSPDFTI